MMTKVFQLIAKGLSVDQINLNHPVIYLRRDGDTWTLSRLIKKQQQEADRSGPQSPIAIDHIGISDGSIVMDGPNIGDAGIGLAAVGAPDMRAARAEEALRGKPPSEEAFTEAGRLAGEECSPSADQRGSEEYKRHLAQELTIRAVRRAVERALSS